MERKYIIYNIFTAEKGHFCPQEKNKEVVFLFFLKQHLRVNVISLSFFLCFCFFFFELLDLHSMGQRRFQPGFFLLYFIFLNESKLCFHF